MIEAFQPVIETSSNSQWWASPLAIIVSAAVAGYFAHHSLKTQREVARKRATLDVILKSESDRYYERIYKAFSAEQKRDGGLTSIFNAKSESELATKFEVDCFLNHYELIAVSIEENILDENFYKTWMKSTYVRHFKIAEEYILKVRNEKNKAAFVKFEELARKWDSV